MLKFLYRDGFTVHFALSAGLFLAAPAMASNVELTSSGEGLEQSPESASDGAQPDSETDGQSKTVCKIQRKTGSNMPRKICRTVEQSNDETEGMRTLDHMRNRREAQQRVQQSQPL